MDFNQAMAEIKKGLIRPVYLLHGEESYLARQLERAIIEAALPEEERDMGLTVLERDPQMAELANLVESVPFLGGKNVIVVRGTQLFRSARKGAAEHDDKREAGDERLLRLLAAVPQYSCLIFVTTDKADKRLKVFKTVEQAGAAVDLSPLKTRDLRPWVVSRLAEMGRKMTPDALDHLLAAVSMMPQVSLGFIDNELEKAALYSDKPAIDRQELVAVMSAVPEVSVFAMIEALSQKQAAKALTLLAEQFTAGENAVRLLALLTRQVRLLWGARELAGKGLDSGSIATELGVPPFVGEKLARQSRGFTAVKLRQAMVELAAADRDLKSGRTDKFVLERIVLDLCR